MLLGKALAESPYPPGLNADQRKLYRDALQEKAKPLYAEARDTLESADEKAHELGVVGACPTKVAQLLEKVGGDVDDREKLELAPSPLVGVPDMVPADEVDGERAKRVLGEALAGAASLSPSGDQLPGTGVVENWGSRRRSFANVQERRAA